MEKRWTPGPWEYGPANNYHGFYIAPIGTLPTLAACERFGDVMTVHCFNFPGATEANARLIASAPELYEALLGIVECKRMTNLPNKRQYQVALAALAKASGETGERGGGR